MSLKNPTSPEEWAQRDALRQAAHNAYMRHLQAAFGPDVIRQRLTTHPKIVTVTELLAVLDAEAIELEATWLEAQRAWDEVQPPKRRR